MTTDDVGKTTVENLLLVVIRKDLLYEATINLKPKGRKERKPCKEWREDHFQRGEWQVK